MVTQPPVFAIVAGEASGDLLGADLIRALKEQFPDALFEGIGGPKMLAEGFQSLFEMDRLSVMGFTEPLKRLPELLRMRGTIIKRYSQNKPAVFVGIDSPDFNLTIEAKLHSRSVKTVHYVSPSVWAWRQGRIKKIKKSVDLMLSLFPFEAGFYHKHDVPVCCVGHPLAKQLPMQPDTLGARRALGLDTKRPVLCIMPGSRAGEVELMAELFLDVAAVIDKALPGLQLIIPAANSARYDDLEKILSARETPVVTLLRQQSHVAMEASDVVLLASGTTALEAMLLKKPMVVSYRLGSLTYALVSPFIKTPFASIPNLLANEMLVPELIQDQATVEALSDQVLKAFNPDRVAELAAKFQELHQLLAVNSGSIAAAAIAKLIAE